MKHTHWFWITTLVFPVMCMADVQLNSQSPAALFVSAKQVNPIYKQQWQKADNRHTCAPLVLSKKSFAHLEGARSRSASFAGGWAVAYDTPIKRSAYGVAGAGSVAEQGDVERWVKYHYWSDGSGVGWGLEGDTGPNHLAYVHLKGQKCLYNVWSSISETHLLQMINDLRMLPQ